MSGIARPRTPNRNISINVASQLQAEVRKSLCTPAPSSQVFELRHPAETTPQQQDITSYWRDHPAVPQSKGDTFKKPPHPIKRLDRLQAQAGFSTSNLSEDRYNYSSSRTYKQRDINIDWEMPPVPDEGIPEESQIEEIAEQQPEIYSAQEEHQGSMSRERHMSERLRSENSSVASSHVNGIPHESQITTTIISCPFFYFTPHSGVCTVSCSDFDTTIQERNLPENCSASRIYDASMMISPHGFPLVGIQYKGATTAWVSPDDPSTALLQKLILSHHEIQLKILWQAKIPVHGYGNRYAGTANWIALCDEDNSVMVGVQE
ncbi:hypothetical protein BJ508DRAFT_300934 [Ascobolus immersus RN42]|uniref:Uncharacterized protein n=1 Tax=Ascobolus immersus RN42 TaxID=1160509 RepID=A0A3N4ING4_ASCIM|nr:hypothetical protein BJ508DRAFT_300934 [Ascobolus immersus RN42]